eukprot:TRINITY_DN7717_c0_g1_i1.p1 TRINITY_DN7717_c0_g1~~TRINITY_DN7717_c0_g1_i1.p1  ORF type:complete len:463 (+),score=155.86 TRINITY_DN7717_c0_g1_i1:17-1405(+)
MLKQKTTDLKDSNISGLGSKENIDLRKKASELEKEWLTAGKKEGVEIWRIEKFEVKKWDPKMYGTFYTGDSYIVLHTFKKDEKSNSLRFNLFYWFGHDSTQDEMGTAAYKAVELDDYLGGVPVESRELQDNESKEFLNCFNGKISYLEGGIESGFDHVKPEEYKARLMHVKGRTEQSVVVKEVPIEKKSMNEGDVFVLDLGLQLIQWNGRSANVMEKRKGADFCKDVDAQRNCKTKIRVIESGDDDEEFWKPLGGKGPIAEAIPDEEIKKKAGEEKPFTKLLFRLSDASGTMEFTEAARGTIKTTDFKSEDVFIMDVGKSVFAWIGDGTTKEERSSAIKTSLDYLVKNNRPTWIPVFRVLEGKETESFFRCLDDVTIESGILRIPPRVVTVMASSTSSTSSSSTSSTSSVSTTSTTTPTTTTTTTTTTTQEKPPMKKFCGSCGGAVKKIGVDRFCRKCGEKL